MPSHFRAALLVLALALAFGGLAAAPGQAATTTIFQGETIPVYSPYQSVSLTAPVTQDAQGATAVFTFLAGGGDRSLVFAFCCSEWFYRGPFRPNAVTGLTFTAQILDFSGNVTRSFVKTAYWCRRPNANGYTAYQGLNFVWQNPPRLNLTGCYPDSARPAISYGNSFGGLVRVTLDIEGQVTTDDTTLDLVVTTIPLPAPVAALGAGLGLLTLLRLSRRRA